jgi:O-antigen/teichoic acid export membrane protein
VSLSILIFKLNRGGVKSEVNPNSLYSLVRGVLGVVLILAGFGSFGQVVSYTASNLIAGLSVTILLFIIIKFERSVQSQNEWDAFRDMMTFGLPFYMKNLVISGLSQVYQTLMTLYVGTELIGNYSAARNFGVLVSFLTIPIGTVLFPLFSMYRKGDSYLRILYFKAVKYTTIVTLPMVACIILVSEPLSKVLFGPGYSYLPLYLSLFILTYAFEGLGGTTQEYLILGVGESRISFIAGIITFIVGSALSLVLIPQYQIIGLLAASLIAPRAGWIYSTIWLKRNLGFNADWRSSFKIYLSTAIAFIFSYMVMIPFHFEGWTALATGTGIFFIIYIVALLLTGALNRGALKELVEVAKVFGPFASPLKTVLILIQRLARN